MDKAHAVKIVREFISRQFPKDCVCCGKHYASLREYLGQTTHVGKPISYDAEKEDWNPTDPVGTFSMDNCACGTTLAIDSDGMELNTLWELMDWAKSESEKRGMSVRDILENLRTAIDQSVLHDNNQAL